MPKFARGEIWLVDLKPQAHKAEPAKERPCLILQHTDICNVTNHGTIIVVPISGESEDPAGESELRVRVGKFAKDPGGKPEEGFALVDCIRSVAKARFVRGPIHQCPTPALRQIEKSLKTFLAL